MSATANDSSSTVGIGSDCALGATVSFPGLGRFIVVLTREIGSCGFNNEGNADWTGASKTSQRNFGAISWIVYTDFH
jgi:hypothetical protein